MYTFEGKFKNSNVLIINKKKYYLSSSNKKIAYCAYRQEKCPGRAVMLKSGKWTEKGTHSHEEKNRDYVSEKKATNEILELCRTTERKKSEIFKAVCLRYISYDHLTSNTANGRNGQIYKN